MAGAVFLQNLGGVVGTAVIGHPNVPDTGVVLVQYGIQGGPDSFGLVPGGDEDADPRWRVYGGTAFSDGTQGTIKAHF